MKVSPSGIDLKSTVIPQNVIDIVVKILYESIIEEPHEKEVEKQPSVRGK